MLSGAITTGESYRAGPASHLPLMRIVDARLCAAVVRFFTNKVKAQVPFAFTPLGDFGGALHVNKFTQKLLNIEENIYSGTIVLLSTQYTRRPFHERCTR